MKKFITRLKNFFLPPAGTPVWLRMLPYFVLGAMTIVLLVTGVYGWEYTNSPQFCGETCHTMPPEYTSYQTSPHARIACVDCHIGKGFITTRVTRKAGDLKHVFATMFNTYEFPIRAGELRPARETCEKCHFPEKFSDDSLRVLRKYANDTNNTPEDIYLTLKTGGGSQRLGLGKGIHWHIENPVYYYSQDPEDQNIPYVIAQYNDGTTSEYLDVEAGFDPQSIEPTELKEMDCITCHNRITHLVPHPEQVVDQMIAREQISEDIPEIRRIAIETFNQVYETSEKGLVGFQGIENFYQTYYPDFFDQNSQKIYRAITALQEAYASQVYPEQHSDWTTHPNNVGHTYSPGCFRCHDGKHLDSNNNAIRLECNLCHSIPIVAGLNDFVANIEINRGVEPQTHLDENWISLHNQVFDESCTNCHTTDDPGGTSNSSFCSNSACHGSSWEYAGFDAPALREIIKDQLPPLPTPQTLPETGEFTYENAIRNLLVSQCASCHSENGMNGLDMSSYTSLMKGGKSGSIITPGSPDESLIIKKQTAEQPHFNQLSKNELDILKQWIQAGAPEK